MTPENSVTMIGVQCFLIKKGCLLLGRRKNIFGDKCWDLPGGQLERGETIFEAAKRELLEETGLVASEANMEIATLGDATADNNYYFQVGVLVQKWDGIPAILEPDLCDTLHFFPIDALPNPIFVSSAPLIEKFLAKRIY